MITVAAEPQSRAVGESSLAALHRLLEDEHGRSVESVRALRPSMRAASHRIDELDVRLDDGSDLALVAKDLSPAGLLPEARLARSGHLHHPWREVVVYRELLAPLRAAPDFLGATVAARAEPDWLFLERVPGVPLVELGAIRAWQDAAAELAALHAAGVEAAATCAEWTVHLLRRDPAESRTNMARAWSTVARASERGEVLPRLEAAHEHALARLADLPVSVTHGDCFPGNVVVCTGPRRTVFVDWETAGLGPALVDLAALTSGSWPARHRDAIADAYRRAALDLGVAARSWTDPHAFARDLAACRLVICVERLAAPPEWSPPEEHRHEWFADACRAAEILGQGASGGVGVTEVTRQLPSWRVTTTVSPSEATGPTR